MYTIFRIIFLFFALFSFCFSEQFSDSFRLDGYGDIKIIEQKENRDDFVFSGGIQGRYQIFENTSITGQVHFEEGVSDDGRASNSLKDYTAELKWFYFDYYLKNDITLRAGAFQFPVFKSSETGDIGYTYTWTQTPLSFYGVFGCDDFKGAEVLKNFSYKNFDFLAQLSYGFSKNELDDGRGNTKEGDVKDLVALTLKTTHENFILNVGYLQASSTMGPSGDPFAQNSEVDFSMYALESEIYLDEYTLKLGVIKTKLSDIFPDGLNYYSSLEYSFDDITPYILYSRENEKFKEPLTIDPLAPPRPNLDSQYKEKYSIGLRYDFNANIALKASFTKEFGVTKFDSSKDRRSEDTFMGTINVVF